MQKRMISRLVVLLVATVMVACTNGGSNNVDAATSVSGTLTNGQGKEVILEKLTNTEVVALDTATIDEQGRFSFGVDVEETGFYRVILAQNNFVLLIVSKDEKIELTGDADDLFKTYSVLGSTESARMQELGKYTSDRDSLQLVLQQAQARQDANAYYQAMAAQNVIMEELAVKVRTFIEANPAGLASLAALQNLNPDTDFPYFNKVSEAMNAEAPNSPFAIDLKKMVDGLKKLAVGSPAPDIILNNPVDKSVSLSSLKGQVVLIDFWASWCKPCRAENPNVVRMYKKYHDQGFEIFGVSLDRTKEAWVQAIKDDGLEWIHASDLAFWNSTAAKLYNVKSIPQTYLVDKEGTIIAKNLRGPELEAKLAEIFGE